MTAKEQIAHALSKVLGRIRRDEGFRTDVQDVNFERTHRNFRYYDEAELPIVQIIDVAKDFRHEFGRSESRWRIVLDLILREDERGAISQADLWAFEDDVVRALMADPKLGLSFVSQVRLLDVAADLTLEEPFYVASLGLEVIYYEELR